MEKNFFHSNPIRVNEEPLDRQVRWDPLVTKDRLESVVCPVLRGLLVPREAQANKENLESLEKKVPMARLVVPEIKDPQVPLEHQDLLDVMVPLESLDPLDLQVRLMNGISDIRTCNLCFDIYFY